MISHIRDQFGRVALGPSTPLLAANLLEALVPFVRNVALARLISPENLGLAISLSIVLGIVEVLSDFGLPVFVVRKANRIPHDAMMGTLQSLALVRSTILGAVLIAISPWVAAAFQATDAAQTYAVLGLIAFLRGFENLTVKGMMQQSSFWREALVVSGAQVAGLVVTVGAAVRSPDLTCMIWGMLAATVITVALSHILSPTRYRLSWDREAAADAVQFGRPLLINGFAVSVTLLDRFLIGSFLGPRPLALYNVAYGTAQLPRTVLAKFLISAFLPLFVHERERGSDAAALFDTWAWCLSCLAFTYGLVLSLVGDQALALVFGAAYQPSRAFMCLAGLSVCIKVLALLPVPAAYAAGETRLIAFGSILSALAIVPGAVLLLLSHDPTLFLLGMTVADFLALLVFGREAGRKQSFNVTAAWCAIGVPSLLLASLAALTWLAPQITVAGWLGAGLIALLLSGGLYGLMLARFDIGLRPLIRS